MNDKTIERTEKKYLISASDKQRLLKSLKQYLKKDKYFSSTVCNLYFDTKNDDLIIASNDRPFFKQKFRLRSYNVPKKSDLVFLETKTKLKFKREKMGNKRRLALSLKDFYDFKDHKTSLEKLFEDSDFRNLEIAKELDYAFNFYALVPKIIIIYDRESYAAVEDPDFRLTFDSNLRFRTDKLNLEQGDSGKPYFSAEEPKPVIMEVKTLDAMPLWFVKKLSDLKLYPVPFSKYGKIYNQLKKGK